MKDIVLVVITVLFVFFLNGSFASDEGVNPLVGTWRSDRERTLSELHSMVKPPQKVIRCFESKICGKNIVGFMKNEYWTIILDKNGNQISRKKASYKILNRGPGFIVIDQMENGGVSKIFLIKGGFYIDVPEFGYRDYYKKIGGERLKGYAQ